MAKHKKSQKDSARKSASGSADTHAQAERLGRSITESAQQIWLAGMGAFNRAQSEGGKLFESLVRDGLSLEQSARKFAGARAEVVREAVEDTVGQAKERASDTWDKLEHAFEGRVQRALLKLGVPDRADLDSLGKRVDRLTAELRKNNASAPKAARTPSKPAAPKVVARKPAAPTVRKPATSKVRKRAAKSASD